MVKNDFKQILKELDLLEQQLKNVECKKDKIEFKTKVKLNSKNLKKMINKMDPRNKYNEVESKGTKYRFRDKIKNDDEEFSIFSLS